MLNSGNTSGMNKMLLQLFEEWEKSACPQQWVEKMLHQILLLLQQNLYFSEEDYEKCSRMCLKPWKWEEIWKILPF